jgi:PAS domain S-box-containing protein
MKRAASKIKKLRKAAIKQAAAPEPNADSLMEQMLEQQNLLELQNEQLNEAHEQMEQSHHRYADLYDRAPLGYLTLDGRGCIREINQTAAQLLGWSLAHLMGRPLLPHITSADRKVFLKHLWDCRHSPDQVTTVLRLTTKDLGQRYVQFASTPTDEFGNRPTWCRTAIFDITEQHLTETALSASEAKFRLLAENIGDVFWFMDLNPARVTYVSPAFDQIWGMPASDLYANHALWEQAIHPEDLPAVHTAFHRWLKGETSAYRIEYRVQNRQGEIRWLADRGIVIGLKDGSPNQISGIARDITERKRAEMALAEKANETNTILEGTHDGILIADIETRRFTFGNTAMCRMLDVTPEELLAMDLGSIHPQEALPELRLKFDAMARGELAFAENVPLLRKDGSIIPVDITASPVVIKGRLHNVGVFHDISERKRAEEKFRGLLEAAPDAMMIHSTDGRIQIVNAQVEKLFGYTRAELIGQTMEMLMPERFRHRHVQHRRGYKPTAKPRPMGRGDMTLLALHKNGREIPVEISLSNLGASDGSLVISSIRDITKRQQEEVALRQSQRFAMSTLEAIPASLAVLDETGTIISTNQSWDEFSLDNGGVPGATSIGANYLRVCETATGEGADDAHRFAVGIHEVLSGASRRFSMEYPCHTPKQQRWFVGYVTAFAGNGAPHVVIAHVDISSRKRAEQVIRRLNDELERRVEDRTEALNMANKELQGQIAVRRQLEEEILHISEREQQRIGQDLHDDLGQQLAGIWLLCEVLKTSLAKQHSTEVESAEKITLLLKNALALTRSLARGLHPVAVEVGGLGKALDELSTRTSDMFRINCHCRCQHSVNLDNTTATHLYRIAQEAVTNAVKHGRAKEIEIELSSNPHHTALSIVDNGSGLPELDPNRTGMGLRIMRYRTDMIGGALKLDKNSTGHGTIVTCTIPTPVTIEPANQPSHGQDSTQPVGKKTKNKSLHC